eukprot:4416446-Prymnesium_polylepis.1
MASSPRRPPHHGETACIQVGPLQFPRPRFHAMQHDGRAAMPATTCSQRPTTTPTSRRVGDRPRASREP